jgi:hypothetical protein
MTLDADVKGDAYEAAGEERGRHQVGRRPVITPRVLISAMVDVMQPAPDMRRPSRQGRR